MILIEHTPNYHIQKLPFAIINSYMCAHTSSSDSSNTPKKTRLKTLHSVPKEREHFADCGLTFATVIGLFSYLTYNLLILVEIILIKTGKYKAAPLHAKNLSLRGKNILELKKKKSMFNSAQVPAGINS